MLLVLPVTRSDVKQALPLAKWIATLGNVESHRVLVVGTQKTLAEATEITEILKPVFKSTFLFIPDKEHDLGWPSSANFMFQQAGEHIFRSGNREPWYWFEADNVPMHANWLNDLETEYNLAQKPFMGSVSPSRIIDPKTKKLVALDVDYMNGSGIYHWDLVGWSDLFGSIHTFKEAQPWDLYLRYELNGKIHPTKKILNNWKTKNYSRTADGRVVCDYTDENYPNETVPDGTTVVHGCKDDSLLNLLKKERTPKANKKDSE